MMVILKVENNYTFILQLIYNTQSFWNTYYKNLLYHTFIVG